MLLKATRRVQYLGVIYEPGQTVDLTAEEARQAMKEAPALVPVVDVTATPVKDAMLHTENVTRK